EIIVIGLILLLLIYFAVILVKTIIDKNIGYFKAFFINITFFFSFAYFLYVLFCGINYYRYEFTYYSGLEINKSSKEQLVNLCEILIEDANVKRSKLNSKNETAELCDVDFYSTTKRAKQSIDKIS